MSMWQFRKVPKMLLAKNKTVEGLKLANEILSSVKTLNCRIDELEGVLNNKIMVGSHVRTFIFHRIRKLEQTRRDLSDSFFSALESLNLERKYTYKDLERI